MSTETPVRPTSAELIESLQEAASRIHDIRSRPADQRRDTHEREARAAIEAVNCLDAELRAIMTIEEVEYRAEQARLDAEARQHQGAGPTAATGNYADGEFRTAGQQFSESEEWSEWIKESRGKGASPSVEVRTLITSSQTDTSSAGLFMPRGTPFLGNVDRRRLFVRDLMPSGPTGLSSIPYIREVNPRSLETGATSVAEGTAKPEVTMQFVEADAIVRKLAAWIPVTYEILQDAPTLRTYIDGRMGYMLMVAEENQLINGTGTGSDLPGILNVVGHQTRAGSASDRFTAIGMAMSDIEVVDLEADGLVINPVDFWTAVTTRQTTRYDGEGFVSGGNTLPYGQVPDMVFGQQAVRTRAIAANHALLGAWRIGGQIFDREGITMRSSDSHVDYFVNNKVALLAERREAVAWYRPDGWVYITYS